VQNELIREFENIINLISAYYNNAKHTETDEKAREPCF